MQQDWTQEPCGGATPPQWVLDGVALKGPAGPPCGAAGTARLRALLAPFPPRPWRVRALPCGCSLKRSCPCSGGTRLAVLQATCTHPRGVAFLSVFQVHRGPCAGRLGVGSVVQICLHKALRSQGLRPRTRLQPGTVCSWKTAEHWVSDSALWSLSLVAFQNGLPVLFMQTTIEHRQHFKGKNEKKSVFVFS